MTMDEELRAQLAAAHAAGDWTRYAVLRAQIDERMASRARVRAKDDAPRCSCGAPLTPNYACPNERYPEN